MCDFVCMRVRECVREGLFGMIYTDTEIYGVDILVCCFSIDYNIIIVVMMQMEKSLMCACVVSATCDKGVYSPQSLYTNVSKTACYCLGIIIIRNYTIHNSISYIYIAFPILHCTTYLRV